MAAPTAAPPVAPGPLTPTVELVPLAVCRLLSDRSFDKRKAGAQEIEKLMRRLQGSRETTRKTLVYLVQEFALSAHANNRKGGLIALASAAIGLGPQIAEHLDLLVPAITKSFNDPEARVRFYACESLFNLSKICRGAVLAFFGDIFAGICKLVADQDTDVKNGAALYDRLLKEVVMESERLDVERFIPLLRSHLGGGNPYVRQLLVGWITALDSVPGITMLDWLPELLEGLFDMLSDVNRDSEWGTTVAGGSAQACDARLSCCSSLLLQSASRPTQRSQTSWTRC